MTKSAVAYRTARLFHVSLDDSTSAQRGLAASRRRFIAPEPDDAALTVLRRLVAVGIR
jgi:hypothetical protein